MSTKGIRATGLHGLPKRNRTYAADRRCSHPGCITKLSAYNRYDACYVHAQIYVPRLRGKKVA
jgi:hypothetical protein